MKRSFLVLMLVITGLAGCNTVNGVGKDIKSVGDTVSDASK
jgi:predicted small secreted protein